MVKCFREPVMCPTKCVQVEFNFPSTVLETANSLKLDSWKHLKYAKRARLFLGTETVFSSYALIHTVLHSSFYPKMF